MRRAFLRAVAGVRIPSLPKVSRRATPCTRASTTYVLLPGVTLNPKPGKMVSRKIICPFSGKGTLLQTFWSVLACFSPVGILGVFVKPCRHYVDNLIQNGACRTGDTGRLGGIAASGFLKKIARQHAHAVMPE